MIVQSIISDGIKNSLEIPKNVKEHEILYISEFFYNSIQGENFVGFPSAFLRLQGCSLHCGYCDTFKVWKNGSGYSMAQLFDLIDQTDLVKKLKNGQHLILTGGSPLKQQKALINFLYLFKLKYLFLPFIEIENECVIMPSKQLIPFIKIWNNSPKLSGSGNPKNFRYKPEILSFLSGLKNSWFKFVVYSENQWNEIEQEYIIPGYIKKEQIILMPIGATKKELEETRKNVVEMAIKYNVRFCDREHIIIWDARIGV